MCDGSGTAGKNDLGTGSTSMAPWMDPKYSWGFNTAKDLNAIGDEGLTVRQMQSIGRQAGYTGDYGQGGLTNWLGQDPNRMSSWQGLIGRYAGEDINPYQSGIQARSDWQRQQRSGGYSGDFSDIDPLYGAPAQPSTAGGGYTDIPWDQILGGIGTGGGDFVQGRGAWNTSFGLSDLLGGGILSGLGAGNYSGIPSGALNWGGATVPSPWVMPSSSSGQNVEPSSYNPWGVATRTSSSMSPLIYG